MGSRDILTRKSGAKSKRQCVPSILPFHAMILATVTQDVSKIFHFDPWLFFGFKIITTSNTIDTCITMTSTPPPYARADNPLGFPRLPFGRSDLFTLEKFHRFHLSLQWIDGYDTFGQVDCLLKTERSWDPGNSKEEYGIQPLMTLMGSL